ncbi:hypothetical protein D9615_007961 [Tricholomella constricta]|uniref:non-specific serine/threonine protein kinase n=1 Tax=Tricholomella constricta TaxID=117010 RepID=A0A8H5LZ55_9AGAR|nr:hypothetical protein D9615_007961 [Tricholomella constricta]
MNTSASLQIPSQDSPAGQRPVSAAVHPAPPPPSSSRRQQRASHTVVSQTQASHHNSSSRDDTPPYTDVYSHPAAVAYATAHPRRTIPKFGPYLLLQTLGEGEFGKVKLGLHSQWGEEVAVKLIRRGNVDNTVRMSKVEREIEVLRTLKHPNIVRLYDVIETDKYIGIILEYASGGELFDHILAHRYLRERDAAKLFSQLISGVWYIHQKKIVHRDLKLENLLLDRHRNVIITDFGFANRFEHRSDDLMQTSCGSPCYAAPELVISEGLYVGSAVDIWSCGVILYAMLAGYLPFDDDPANPDGDNINLLYKYIVNTPLSFPEYISAEARDLLGMMLVPDPLRRSSLEAVMRHPWLAAYAMPKDGLPLPPAGTPAAFGRSVDQLERAALDQHQQRRLAYQRQMRAAAQAQAQAHAAAAPVGRTQSHYIHHSGNASASPVGHRAAATESSSHGPRSHSTQPEFLYDSSVDLSMASPASKKQTQGPVLGGDDDDPFGPPPSSAGKAAGLAVEPQTPKGHKTNGSGSGSGREFRHTIQVEYDEPRTHGRSGSGGARRSEDRQAQEQQQQQNYRQQQEQPQGRPIGAIPSPAVSPAPTPKERRPSQGSISIAASKPLPSTPPVSASANGTTTPSSFRGLPTPPTASVPASPKPSNGSGTPTKSSHRRTPSTPVQTHPQTPNISVNAASPPGTPIAFANPAQKGEDAASEDERESRGRSGKSRASVDKLGLGKVFGHGAGASEGRVPSDGGSGRSASSVLLSPPGGGEKGKEREGKEKEKEIKEKDGKKSTRRNTLTVMVEPFRSTIRNRGKGRVASSTGSGEPLSAASTTMSTSTHGRDKEKSKSPQPPHSALPGSGAKSGAGPVPSYAGATGEMGVIEDSLGMQASTSKARKVMAWFRSKSKVPEAGGAEDDHQEVQRSTTPTQAEYVHVQSPSQAKVERENMHAVQVVVTTPTSGTPRMPPPSAAPSHHHPQRTPSTATADTTFSSTTTSTPSLVTRFRNSVTIGGGAHRNHNHERERERERNHERHHERDQHPWGMLRTHHGAVDQSTITTKPPPEVIRHVREVLEGMGMEIQVESEYKYRCIRPKRRKGPIALGAASTPPPGASVGGNVSTLGGGGLAAVTMVGSAASNGVDKRGLPVPSPSSFTAPGGMLRGLLMRRQSSQVSSSGLASPLDDDVISSPLTAEPGHILGTTAYGDPTQDAGDEVKFSVELTRIDRLNDTFSLDIRRMKGNLRSYKFLYDTLRDRADLQR